MLSRFEHDRYLIRKQFFKLFGGAFRIYDPTGSLAFYADMKAFKLKEDIRVYTDEQKQTEVLSIKARNIIDFSAAYDVEDSMTGERVGVLKRKGLKSTFLRDEWIIMNAQDEEIGYIREESMFMALLRRFAGSLLFPQSFIGFVNEQTVFTMKQNFNPFILKLTIDFSMDHARLLDRRLGIAAAILLCAIEGRQNN